MTAVPRNSLFWRCFETALLESKDSHASRQSPTTSASATGDWTLKDSYGLPFLVHIPLHFHARTPRRGALAHCPRASSPRLLPIPRLRRKSCKHQSISATGFPAGDTTGSGTSPRTRSTRTSPATSGLYTKRPAHEHPRGPAFTKAVASGVADGRRPISTAVNLKQELMGETVVCFWQFAELPLASVIRYRRRVMKRGVIGVAPDPLAYI